MGPRASAAVELDWPQVNAFRLQRHHLSVRAPKKDLAHVVGHVGGAQAQLMSAAELQIAVRSRAMVTDVRDALWKDRTLVKTWLMRGTLHLARADDLPLYTAAMRGRWMRIRPSWLKYMQLTESEFWRIEEEIGAALDGRPVTREDLMATVGKGKSARVHELLRSVGAASSNPPPAAGCFVSAPAAARP